MVKGNHDYWWTTAAKFQKFCAANGFENLYLLHNNCYFYEDRALCGTRGWFFEEDNAGTHNEKVYLREMMRLETSLRAAGEAEKICFLHYPPRYRGYECPRKGTIVMDICGVKQMVLEHADRLYYDAGIHFIGTHPMAGKEVAGFANSDADLYRGASMILTPTELTDRGLRGPKGPAQGAALCRRRDG